MLVAEIESIVACNAGRFCPKLHHKVDFVPAVTLKYLITKLSVVPSHKGQSATQLTMGGF